MATSWKLVRQSAQKEDQIRGTYNPDDGTVKLQVIQTYDAITMGTGGVNGGPTGSVADALTASDGTVTVPQLGDDLVVGSNTYTVTDVLPKRTGANSFEIRIQGDYTYTPPKPSDSKWNVSVTFSGVDYEQDATKDKDGNPVVNSAGQPFDPSLKHTYNDEKISISYNTTVEQSLTFTGVRGKVNSSSVTLTLPGISRSFDARTIRCDDAEQSQDTPLQDGTVTFKVSLNFTVRADGFTDHVLDQGFYELNDDGELVQIKDKWGDILSAPALLDGNGNMLPDGADPVFLDFPIEDEADFTSAFSGLGV